MPPKKQAASAGLRQPSIASFFGVPVAKRAAEVDETGAQQFKAPKIGAPDVARQERGGEMGVDAQPKAARSAGTAGTAAAAGSQDQCPGRHSAEKACGVAGAARAQPTPPSPSERMAGTSRPVWTSANQLEPVAMPGSAAHSDGQASPVDAAERAPEQGAACPECDELIRPDGEKDESPASNAEGSGEGGTTEAEGCATRFTSRTCWVSISVNYGARTQSSQGAGH
jgi:hypothetical protein